jgi:hypothetical protein
MHDAAAGGHPLHVARPEAAPVAKTVAMFDVSREHVGDRLNPPVRVPRKTGAIVFGVLVAEVVEQQKRIELRRITESERAPELDARTLDMRL